MNCFQTFPNAGDVLHYGAFFFASEALIVGIELRSIYLSISAIVVTITTIDEKFFTVIAKNFHFFLCRTDDRSGRSDHMEALDWSLAEAKLVILSLGTTR